MITISLCMIVKDEAMTLANCLESIYDLVDEINIIDTGSTDETKEIASQYTDRIFDFTWNDDFAAARNFSFQQATSEYILWLDADDIILEPDRKRLESLKENLSPTVDAVCMDYNYTFDEHGNVITKLKKFRLVKQSRDFKWSGIVHEDLNVDGQLVSTEITVTHRRLQPHTQRNIDILEKALLAGHEFSPKEHLFYGNELTDCGRYEDAIPHYIKFIESDYDWLVGKIQACHRLHDCYLSLGQNQQSLEAVLQTLKFAYPHPQTCCKLGYHFFLKEEYQTAILWYNQALNNNNVDEIYLQNMAFATWFPHLQLCICYDRLGEYFPAYQHIQSAYQINPMQSSINEAYHKFKDAFEKVNQEILST